MPYVAAWAADVNRRQHPRRAPPGRVVLGHRVGTGQEVGRGWRPHRIDANCVAYSGPLFGSPRLERRRVKQGRRKSRQRACPTGTCPARDLRVRQKRFPRHVIRHLQLTTAARTDSLSTPGRRLPRPPPGLVMASAASPLWPAPPQSLPGPAATSPCSTTHSTKHSATRPCRAHLPSPHCSTASRAPSPHRHYRVKMRETA